MLRNDGQHHGQSDQDSDHDNDQDVMKQILVFCQVPKSASEIMKRFGLERSCFRRHYLDKLLETGKLKRPEPEKLRVKINNIILKCIYPNHILTNVVRMKWKSFHKRTRKRTINARVCFEMVDNLLSLK